LTSTGPSAIPPPSTNETPRWGPCDGRRVATDRRASAAPCPQYAGSAPNPCADTRGASHLRRPVRCCSYWHHIQHPTCRRSLELPKLPALLLCRGVAFRSPIAHAPHVACWIIHCWVNRMFDIRLLDNSERGREGQRLGVIRIGDFAERFACHATGVPVEDLPARWLDALQSLVRGASSVALVHDPRFAWIVYREGADCFVQQSLALDGDSTRIPVRETTTEEGDPISEWQVPLVAIEDYVRTQQRAGADAEDRAAQPWRWLQRDEA